MKKSDLIKELERIPGDPEIEIRAPSQTITVCCRVCDESQEADTPEFIIDRINEFPRPEIIIVEK